MKKFRLLLAVAFGVIAFGAQAQIDYNDPRWAAWGDTAEARETNMLNNTFLKESITNKDYGQASHYLNEMIKNAPTASQNIYAYGIVLFKNKINRAKSLAEKNASIDSLMLMHDLRLKYFGDHATQGAAYILDSKARLYATYRKADREGMRDVFKEAVKAGGDSAKADLVYIYFQNVCDDYKMDEVMADEVLALYDELSPYFAKLEGEDAEFSSKFEACFGLSGAASCENLESMFTKRLAAAPDDVKLLKQAVALMGRANCDSEFYLASAEKLYTFEKSSESAMGLASAFQNKGEFDKASQYLADALAAESDVEEREKLQTRIALVEMAASRMDKALVAARAAIATEDDTLEDNGIALFVLAQCYAGSARSCSDFDAQAVYWVAADTMNRALQNFTAEEEGYRDPAQKLLANYNASFPTKESGFFNEVAAGSSYRVGCGAAAGISTTARYHR